MPVTELDPHTALVLIDLQQGIGAMAPADLIDPVADAAGRLAAGFRARGLPVVLVRVEFSADLGDFPRNRATAAVPPPATLPAGFAQILPAVGRRPEDLLVTKRQPGAFYGTDLDLQLRRRGVTGIVLGGVFTSIGVESTARAGYDHGYNITFAADAMADRNPAAHEHSVRTVFPRYGEVGDVASILRLLPVGVPA
jgi:nicotinamidase-related amidase